MRYYEETLTSQCKNCGYTWKDEVEDLKSDCPKCGSAWIDVL